MANAGVSASYPTPPIHYFHSGLKPTVGSSPEQVSMSSASSPLAAQPGHPGEGGQDKGGLSNMNLNFLKGLTEKKTTREGNPPKRRGPKPDAKPALTRRQELNRQAQRTHRERKELYIKALEDEVLRLKEIFSAVSHDKEKLAEENKQLRLILQQNGLAGASPGGMDDIISNPSLGYTSSGSVSGGYGAGSSSAFTPPLTSQSTAPSLRAAGSSQTLNGQQMRNPSRQQQSPIMQNRVDYEQSGIDFVLTLEKPCMEHMPIILDRIREKGGEPCGHALMASCPPEAYIEPGPDIPFGNTYTHDHSKDGQRTWELSKGDLATLLDLSKKLDLDGEITPVMAWGMIMAHPRLTELRGEDFQRVVEELKGKVRCYGFGAVMEEFELRDALNAVLSIKSEPEAVPF